MTDMLLWAQRDADTYKVDIASSGDNTILTSAAGRKFCVFHLWLQAEAGVDVTVKSGSTVLTGPITFAANAEKEWKNSGLPVFKARAAGNNLVLNLSGNVQVNGFAVLVENNA